jgi:cation diffusion facilitator CzcD-associated flavoprotein CzcO
MSEAFDVLVIGAGISGVNAAYRLMTRCPRKTFAILEGRDAIGGTWDLFRYPGIRSDSDMFTLGFPFRPWDGEQSIADGASIREYIQATAREHGIDRRIRFGHRVQRASWSSDAARWTVEARRNDTGERVVFECRFLFMCTGYYDYESGYTPDFEGIDRYRGRVVHPQKWTDDVVYEGKRVVVIGSGATAVGLVPALARRAARVTMLQRSPSYVMSFAAVDPKSRWLRERLPPRVASSILRTQYTALTKAIYVGCRRFPDRAKKLLVGAVEKQLGEGFDVKTHFTPRYAPWDQRLCLVRDGDLFEAIARGRVEVVTDTIDTFTASGVRVASGREIPADLVVTATGLRLKLLGGVPLTVDGEPVEVSKTTMYKATMLSGVPNLALSLGYINASWTLRSDLACLYVCRLLNEMDRLGRRTCVPRLDPADASDESVFPLASGYVARGASELPRQGAARPWRNTHQYLDDVLTLRLSRVDDGVLHMA